MGRRTRKAPRRRAPKVAPENEIDGVEEETELIPAAVDTKVIDAVVTKLNEMARASGVELAREMGEIIIDNFFGGELERYRERGERDASLRALAKHPALLMSPASVYRAVGIYDLTERFGTDWKHLSASHLRAVLGLGENDQQKLLTQAEDKEWTADKVEAEAIKLRKKVADGRGRPALPRFQKSLNHIGKYFADVDDSFGDIESLDEIEDKEALKLFQIVSDGKAKFDELHKQLQKRVKGLES
jgi:hypothetical protein